ncbi:aminotransferase class IV family protein [Daeguia caeni]|uniref:Probable branched-chain-amino-acid aminotransferase n=1 Tax=Daeguia caeni TaxID=439612 RepID=A0ABV9H2L6_9HYPH
MSSQGTVCDGTKAGTMMAIPASPDFQLIETMRWEPLSGILRLDLHLARLENSARELGFACDMDSVRKRLAQVTSVEQPLRLRLTLAPDGVIGLTSTPYAEMDTMTVWRLAIARTRLDSADPLLRHKTTRRQAYLAAREEFSPAEIDEVLLLNERDEVCEGTITTVFLDVGKSACITPPLSSGLLDGVLRRELLNNGATTESIVTIDDLLHASDIFVGNSLRGMIRARLVQF